MDISVRDWMIIIGVLLIVAVLLDGYRRMRDPNRIRVSLSRVPDGADEDISVSRELPNGGARVRPRNHTDASEQGVAGGDDTNSVRAQDVASSAANTERDTQAESLDDHVSAAVLGEPPLLTEPLEGSDPLFDLPPMPTGPAAGDQTIISPAADRAAGETLDLLDGITADDQSSTTAEPKRAAATDRDGPGEDGPHAGGPHEVLMLHVVARDEAGFSGDDILQVLLAYNLRFGDMDFFHCHEQSAGRGAIQFSVANMLQPGVFDIDRMSNFSTSGLIFFLTLPGPRDMMAAFERMLETARGVAENLGADVFDDSRSAITRQTLEHMRQRIRDLERKLLAQAGR